MTFAQAWAARFEALNRRERLLLSATLGIALLAVLYVFWIEPRMLALRTTQQQQVQTQSQLQQWREQIALYSNKPVPRVEARIEQLQAQLAAQDQQLQALALDLMPPQRMTPALREVLALTNSSLSLVRLIKAAPEPIRLQGEVSADAEQLPVALYRHTLTVELEGSFSALQDFLSRLETSAPGFFWDQLEVTSETYPAAQIRLQLHTLSIEEGWLGA